MPKGLFFLGGLLPGSRLPAAFLVNGKRSSLQPIFFEFVAEHPLTEAQEPGSLALVSPGLPEGILNHAALHAFQRLVE